MQIKDLLLLATSLAFAAAQSSSGSSDSATSSASVSASSEGAANKVVGAPFAAAVVAGVGLLI
jgi:hypothetical protein